MRATFLLLLLLVVSTVAIVPIPHTVNFTQPDGETSFAVKVLGPHYTTTFDGYTLIQDERTREWQYAKSCTKYSLCPSGVPAHLEPPQDLQKHLIPRDHRKLIQGEVSTQRRRRRTAYVPSTGKLRNLVVLIKFLDHRVSDLPTKEDINILFNGNHDDPDIIPTGSVRDVFWENSYGKLDLSSTVIGWVSLDQTEAYYANNNFGFTERTREMVVEAVKKIENSIDLEGFDLNDDNIVDSITFLHSGHAAEWTYDRNKIWSQKNFLTQKYPSDRSVVGVRSFHIAPARWGASGNDITRIAVNAHEIAHSLGLPDLYDLDRNGEGLGSFSFMANAWGLDGSQYYPPLMSAWGRWLMGWDYPVEITQSGTYKISASSLMQAQYPRIFRISHGFPEGEYLLIENRQPNGFDSLLDEGGLAIYHVDETVSDPHAQGHPLQSGWPQNGLHYHVALLQSDGEYGLERGLDRGNSKDLFRAGHKDTLGPSTSSNGPYPNTDSYQYGNIKRTGIKISKISASANTMSFYIELPGTAVSSSLTTTPTTTTTTPTVTKTTTTTTTTTKAANACSELCPDGTIRFCKINVYGEHNDKCYPKERVDFILSKDGGYCGRCVQDVPTPSPPTPELVSATSVDDCSATCSDGSIQFCKINRLGEHNDKCYPKERVDFILASDGGYCGRCRSVSRDRLQENEQQETQETCTETCSDGSIKFCKINRFGEKNDKCYSAARVKYIQERDGGYCGAC